MCYSVVLQRSHDILHILRCSPAHYGCKETSVTQAFLKTKWVWPFFSDLSHQHGVSAHRTGTKSLVPFCIDSRENPRRSAVSKVHNLAHLALITVPQTKSLRSYFPPLWCLIWTLTEVIDLHLPDVMHSLLHYDWLIKHTHELLGVLIKWLVSTYLWHGEKGSNMLIWMLNPTYMLMYTLWHFVLFYVLFYL